jgi:hypothetical protein
MTSNRKYHYKEDQSFETNSNLEVLTKKFHELIFFFHYFQKSEKFGQFDKFIKPSYSSYSSNFIIL